MTQDTCIRSITNRVNVFANYKASLLSNKSLFISKIQSSRINVSTLKDVFLVEGKCKVLCIAKKRERLRERANILIFFKLKDYLQMVKRSSTKSTVSE